MTQVLQFPKRDLRSKRIAHTMAIDPTTGDYWKANEPEYWDCAAQAWREVITFSTGQEDTRQAGIRQCMSRAEKLRNEMFGKME